jgi:type IV pilus biogenesis protein PilP
MRNKICLLLAVLLGGQALAEDDASVFKQRAKLIEQLQLNELQNQVDGISGKMPAMPLPRQFTAGGPVAVAKSRLIEISGAGGKLVATFRLANGELRDFGAGQDVPGWGKIGAIAPEGVTDSTHHFHPLEAE